jgi:hypothetical protein
MSYQPIENYENKTVAKRLSGRRSTTSLWIANTSSIRSPALGKNTHADVCVVGAGIAGMTRPTC